MNRLSSFPPDYRSDEVKTIIRAVRAGECISVVGLSGSGKSNLLAYLANQQSNRDPCFILVDCNRIDIPSPPALFRLILKSLGGPAGPQSSLEELDRAIAERAEHSQGGICLLFDRFELIADGAPPALFGNLRSLRDAHKYALMYVTATRRPMEPTSELAELFYAHTLWLGPLNEHDAEWSVRSYADRAGLTWDDETVHEIIVVTSAYPALLRAVCEAYAAGCSLQVDALVNQSAVHMRLSEFWSDHPGEAELRCSKLLGQPLLIYGDPGRESHRLEDGTDLTAKENLLLSYFRSHPGVVCEKDDLIRAVWPEDRIFELGIRDDSLAQLVRRLRTKIEVDPSHPRCIHTVTGRGYRYTPGQ